MALSMLTVASRPADDDHPYGHSKAEYFSSGVEGTLILVAALSIAVAAAQPAPGAAAAGAGRHRPGRVGGRLGRQPGRGDSSCCGPRRQHHSITLEANAQHLLTRTCGPRQASSSAWRPSSRPAGSGSTRSSRCWWRPTSLDRHADRAQVDPRPDGHRAAARGTGGRAGRAGQPPEGRRSSTTPCARGSPARGASCRFTCWCRASGPCTAATSCSRTSKRESGRLCRT